MLKYMNEILSAFRTCFSRTAAFKWFVVMPKLNRYRRKDENDPLGLVTSEADRKRIRRYLRTPSKSVVSEATVVAYLRQSLFRMFTQNPIWS